jgi:predicted ester cyclase
MRGGPGSEHRGQRMQLGAQIPVRTGVDQRGHRFGEARGRWRGNRANPNRGYRAGLGALLHASRYQTYGSQMNDSALAPLAAVLRRYSYAYTAAHDFEVCPQIMVDDYELLMGEHRIRGRDDAYIPATARQFRQFPTLGFTVHELLLGEDRAALHFTEHGRSVVHNGESAWRGIGLYRWDGTRLTECRVEQDYHSRRGQQRSGRCAPVHPPGIDPWASRPQPADTTTETIVRSWLEGAGLMAAPVGYLDDEHFAPAQRMRLDDPRVTIMDLFTAGERAAFHVRLDGGYRGGLDGEDEHVGRNARLYATGLVTVINGEVSRVRAVTDRLAAARRMRRTAETAAAT